MYDVLDQNGNMMRLERGKKFHKLGSTLTCEILDIVHDYMGCPDRISVLVTDITFPEADYKTSIHIDNFVKMWLPLPANGQKPKLATKCECGAHTIGVKDYSIGHDSYCPVRKAD